MLLLAALAFGQEQEYQQPRNPGPSLYDIPPRVLVDCPTAGTLPRGHFNIGMRFYAGGGGFGFTDIGLSNRFMIGISYGADRLLDNVEPDWNPDIEFGVKFRLVDEMQYFPAIAVGYSSQGDGGWVDSLKRYTYKSRGFYAVASRSIYFYKWTSGWHGGINYSMEKDGDGDETVNFFVGFDATFYYNLALLLEYDGALNDNTGKTSFAGKGRGYFNASIKWLFTDKLEIELILKDMLTNRREAATFSRELRLMYIDSF